MNKQFWSGFVTCAIISVLTALGFHAVGDSAQCEYKTWTQGRTYVICAGGANAEMNRIITEAEENRCSWEFLPKTARTNQFTSLVVVCQ